MAGILGHSLTRHGASESTRTSLTARAQLSLKPVTRTSRNSLSPVSYTHLTLPTNREV